MVVQWLALSPHTEGWGVNGCLSQFLGRWCVIDWVSAGIGSSSPWPSKGEAVQLIQILVVSSHRGIGCKYYKSTDTAPLSIRSDYYLLGKWVKLQSCDCKRKWKRKSWMRSSLQIHAKIELVISRPKSHAHRFSRFCIIQLTHGEQTNPTNPSDVG